MNLLKRILFNFLNLHISSCILRSKVFKLFGARIGKSVKMEQVTVVNYDGTNMENLVVGDDVYIGAGTILDLKEKITIGTSTKIAAGCNFSTHADCGENNPIYKLYPRKKEAIVIGSHSWIGLNVTILCGTSIGGHSIIGAGSLVNKNLPANVIAFGNPAQVVKALDLSETG